MSDAAGLEEFVSLCDGADEQAPHETEAANREPALVLASPSPGKESVAEEPHLLPETAPAINLAPILAQPNQHIAKKKQLKTALAHFNAFLHAYWRREGSQRDLNTIPNHARLYDYLLDSDLQPELVGAFCTYLSNASSKSGRNGYLSAGSCSNYLSAVANYYLLRTYLPNWAYKVNEDDQLPPAKVEACFGSKSEYYRKSSGALKKKISERSKEDGIPLVVPKSGASEEDWIIIAMSCVLQGRKYPTLPEFWAFSIALTHFAARGKLSSTIYKTLLLSLSRTYDKLSGNECAFLQHKQGKTTEVPGSNNEKNVTGIFEVNNFKQAGTFQEMHVFPHISGWYRDFYFAMAYSFAMREEKSKHLFPRFNQEASKTTKDGDNNSTGVSQLWKRELEKVIAHLGDTIEIFKKLVEKELLKDDPEFTEGICSHSPKKYAIRAYGHGADCHVHYLQGRMED